MSASTTTTLEWILLQDRFAEVMAGRSVNMLNQQDRNHIYYQLKSEWGLDTSGYKQIGDQSARTPTPMTLSVSGKGLSTKWGRPETFVFSRAIPVGEGTLPLKHSYVVHVHQPSPLDEPYRAVISLVLIRKHIREKYPAKNSWPLYDPALGVQVERASWYSSPGEILWSTSTNTVTEFHAALQSTDQWLRNRDACDALTAIAPEVSVK